ncbi:MAG TPA: SDR family NAD(P)-dependent oxidoreductase [Mycobacterium sp.]|nr:SDR family NAD(P)-dependent oxidoreductase [Mycobacterium sp.]
MRVIVTGGSSGLGRATAAALAAAGHSVVIAARTMPKAQQAAAEMTGDVEARHLDLADLSNVRRFAESVETVDVLINNAGVLRDRLTRTVDGFEAHMGTNHLGHFALTCLLGDRIKERVVSVTSANYVFGRIHFDDLNWHTRDYSMWAAYADSKLAVMLFIDELARRGVRAYAANPGAANTDIVRHSPRWLRWMDEHLPLRPAQAPSVAARSVIQAVSTDLPSGSYLAPRFSQFGSPKAATPRRKARDSAVSRRLWEMSAELTGCDWRP